MKIIVITSPDVVSGEVSTICRLLDEGIYAVHIRKPEWNEESCRELIESIPERCRDRLVVHQYFEMCEEYHLKGVHLNRRNSQLPENHKGSVSCSCHSLEEVAEKKGQMDYVFLSPIFDSISKQGYGSAFSMETLAKAQRDGVIDEKVIALGGVTYERMPQLEALSFGGGAMLGEIWKK